MEDIHPRFKQLYIMSSYKVRIAILKYVYKRSNYFHKMLKVLKDIFNDNQRFIWCVRINMNIHRINFHSLLQNVKKVPGCWARAMETGETFWQGFVVYRRYSAMLLSTIHVGSKHDLQTRSYSLVQGVDGCQKDRFDVRFASNLPGSRIEISGIMLGGYVQKRLQCPPGVRGRGQQHTTYTNID